MPLPRAWALREVGPIVGGQGDRGGGLRRIHRRQPECLVPVPGVGADRRLDGVVGYLCGCDAEDAGQVAPQLVGSAAAPAGPRPTRTGSGPASRERDGRPTSPVRSRGRRGARRSTS